MEEFKGLKLDDIIVFYASSGYVGSGREHKMSAKDVFGATSQENLDEILKDEKYAQKCLDEEYEEFLANNVDSGYYRE